MLESVVSVEFGLLRERGGARIAFVPNPAVNFESVTAKIRFRFELLLAKIAGKAKAVVTNGLVSAQHASAQKRFAGA